eukprot:TRINITY_DN9901_c0_g1_i1.p2 TRINITY_DN9901_c0_g1~~TRINITY_DN9901_c0_g1_i1.p2  ORF type:complete len:212 (-),score=62.76 TRINITY_DN9901_c0_g1_i1:117-752(-)
MAATAVCPTVLSAIASPQRRGRGSIRSLAEGAFFCPPQRWHSPKKEARDLPSDATGEPPDALLLELPEEPNEAAELGRTQDGLKAACREAFARWMALEEELEDLRSACSHSGVAIASIATATDEDCSSGEEEDADATDVASDTVLQVEALLERLDGASTDDCERMLQEAQNSCECLEEDKARLQEDIQQALDSIARLSGLCQDFEQQLGSE